MTKCTCALTQEVHFHHSMFDNLEYGPIILIFKFLLKIKKQNKNLDWKKNQISR